MSGNSELKNRKVQNQNWEYPKNTFLWSHANLHKNSILKNRKISNQVVDFWQNKIFCAKIKFVGIPENCWHFMM